MTATVYRSEQCADHLAQENDRLRAVNVDLLAALEELVAERENDFHHDTEGFNMARAAIASAKATP